jgi:hypothetical protein
MVKQVATFKDSKDLFAAVRNQGNKGVLLHQTMAASAFTGNTYMGMLSVKTLHRMGHSS